MKNSTVGLLRTYLNNSKSQEEQAARIQIGYRLTSFWFWRFGPRAHRKNGVIERLDFLLEHIQQGQKIVDVGCFDGFYTESLTKKGYDVVGVDRLKPILERTRRIDNSSQYIHGFAEEMPFPAEFFDVGIYSHVLHHVFDPEKAVAEARRILKPKGKIIAIVPHEIGSIQLRVFSPEDLRNLIGNYFERTESYSNIGLSHACIGYKSQ